MSDLIAKPITGSGAKSVRDGFREELNPSLY
jgi:hypothetical protein